MKLKLLITILSVFFTLNSTFGQISKEYYDNGQLKEKGNYLNDNKEGYWEAYFEDGQLEMKGNYKNGVEVGEWTVAREYNDFIPDFKNKNYDLYDSYIFSHLPFYEEIDNGEYYVYIVGIITNGEFQFKNLKTIYNTGQKFFVKSGRKITYYYKNGKVMIKGQIDSDGNRNGIWKVYKKDGNLLFKESVD